MPEQGDIVLVPVPFTDLSSIKRRPVVILSNDAYNRTRADVVVVAMTSNPAIVPYSIKIASADLVEGTLNRPGTIRVDKIYTLAQAIIAKKFGKVSSQVTRQIKQLLDTLTSPVSP